MSHVWTCEEGFSVIQPDRSLHATYSAAGCTWNHHTISELSFLLLTEITPSESSGGRLVFIGVTVGVLLAILAIVAFVMSRWVLVTHHNVHTLSIYKYSRNQWKNLTENVIMQIMQFLIRCKFMLNHLYFQETKVIQTPVVCPHWDSWYSTLGNWKDEALLCIKYQQPSTTNKHTRPSYKIRDVSVFSLRHSCVFNTTPLVEQTNNRCLLLLHLTCMNAWLKWYGEKRHICWQPQDLMAACTSHSVPPWISCGFLIIWLDRALS